MTLDRVSFASEMSKLFAAHGREVRHETMDTYWDAIEQLTLEQLQHAVKRSVENDEAFPKIPKLLTYAREIKVKREVSPFYSFFCKGCESFFSVIIDQLSGGGSFECSSCKEYRGITVRWSTRQLSEARQRAIDDGKDFAEV